MPVALGVFVFLVYLRTLYPGLAGGDSAELAGAVATGGVIHPPGYPLYEVLGRLFLHVLGGSPAWRLNVLSAACDAGAAGVLCAAVMRWSRSWAGGAVAGALFAFSPGIWQYAICAEVFALDNLCVALLLLCAVSLAETRDVRWLVAGAFVSGLGIADHQTVVFTVVPLAAMSLWSERAKLRDPRLVARLGGAFALGLTPYLYLPVAAARHASITWGRADTWAGFWTHVTRGEYGTFQLAPSGIAAPSDGWQTVGAFAADAFAQLGVWGLGLAALGLVVASRRAERRMLVATSVAVLLSVGVFAWLGNLPVTDGLHRGIVARFWQQPEVYLCAWCGLAVGALESRVPRWATTVFVAGLALVPMGVRWGAMDRHTSTLVRSYGVEILRAAPPGSLLLTKGDLITSPMRYLQAVEGLRPDVRIVDQELLGLPWYGALVRETHPEIVLPGPRFMPGSADGFTMRALLDANVDRAPVLVCGGIKPPDVSADGAYGRWPWGLCEQMHRGTEPVDLDAWIRGSGDALPRIDFGDQPRPSGSWEAIVWGDTWEVRHTRAAHLITVAGADPARRRYVGLAADMLLELVAEDPEPQPHYYKTLAIALGRAGLDTPERRAQAADAWRHYLAVAPSDDPMLPAIRKELERLSAGGN